MEKLFNREFDLSEARDIYFDICEKFEHERESYVRLLVRRSASKPETQGILIRCALRRYSLTRGIMFDYLCRCINNERIDRFRALMSILAPTATLYDLCMFDFDFELNCKLVHKDLTSYSDMPEQMKKKYIDFIKRYGY